MFTIIFTANNFSSIIITDCLCTCSNDFVPLGLRFSKLGKGTMVDFFCTSEFLWWRRLDFTTEGRGGGVTSSGIMKENPSKTSSLKGEGKKTARSKQIAKKFRFQKLNTRAFESHIDREVLVNRNPPKTVMLASRTIRKGVMTPSDMSISWGVYAPSSHSFIDICTETYWRGDKCPLPMPLRPLPGLQMEALYAIPTVLIIKSIDVMIGTLPLERGRVLDFNFPLITLSRRPSIVFCHQTKQDKIWKLHIKVHHCQNSQLFWAPEYQYFQSSRGKGRGYWALHPTPSPLHAWYAYRQRLYMVKG